MDTTSTAQLSTIFVVKPNLWAIGKVYIVFYSLSKLQKSKDKGWAISSTSFTYHVAIEIIHAYSLFSMVLFHSLGVRNRKTDRARERERDREKCVL